MNQTIRRIAVSGSAAVALLGGAAAITTATAPSASAAEMQTVINRATGAPVNMPDGRVVHVRGLDAAAYTASPEQHSVIVQVAAKEDAAPSPSIGTGLTPNGGQGAPITNPYTPGAGQQTGYNQQITTQAGGGTIAIGMVSILILGIVVFYKVKHGGLRIADAVIGVVAGVAISGTFLGPMISSMTNSLVGSIGSALSGMG